MNEQGIEVIKQEVRANEQGLRLTEQEAQTNEQVVDANKLEVQADENESEASEQKDRSDEYEAEANEQGVQANKLGAQADNNEAEANEQKAQSDEYEAEANEQGVQANKLGAQADNNEAEANEQKARSDEHEAGANEQGVQANKLEVHPDKNEAEASEQGARADEYEAEANEQGFQANELRVQADEQEAESNEHGVQANEIRVQADENVAGANEQGARADELEVEANEQGAQAFENEAESNELGVQTEEDELEEESVCVACLDSVRTNDPTNDLKFCKCNYKIHHECLKMLYIYWEKEAGRDITGIHCVNCNTEIKLVTKPTKSVLVTEMENASRTYMWLCDKLFIGVTIIVIQQALTTYGLAFLYQIYGKQIANSITNTYGLVKATGLCQSIPLFTMAISLSGWEDTLLVFLRRCSRLPVVGWVFPKEYPGVREVLHRHRFHRLNAIVDGLLLPLYAEATGLLVCSSMEHGLQRLLLGAAAFLSVRGALYMYCRQSRYNIIANRSVANFCEQ